MQDVLVVEEPVAIMAAKECSEQQQGAVAMDTALSVLDASAALEEGTQGLHEDSGEERSALEALPESSEDDSVRTSYRPPVPCPALSSTAGTSWL